MSDMRISHTGPLLSPVAGRTDHIETDVPPESFVIPADVVSGLGEGNTLSGMRVLSRMFGMSEAPQRSFSPGGVPVAVAGGEFVVPPAVVKRIGGGDEARGHKILRSFVTHARNENIKTLRKLPGPHK